MNAMTPKMNTDDAAPVELSMFDFARWKPVTPEMFLSHFGEAAFTVSGGEPIATEAEDMPNGTIRMVVYAKMQSLHDRKHIAVEPYLVVLYNPENRKHSVAMMRTDAQPYKEFDEGA